MKFSNKFSQSVFSLLFLCLSLFMFSQEKPYWQDIKDFKTKDQQNGIPKRAILFIGSSSFTKWQDVNDYFPGKTIINRGFGGSRLVDLNNYANDLLDPYNPKQIVIYCGDNDFAMGNPSVDEVFRRFTQFFGKIRQKYPKVPVAYVSIKYSPSREELWPKMKELNNRIEAFFKTTKRTNFIDITKVMNNADGSVRTDLYVGDMLHMKPEGYRLWAQVIAPYLK